MAHPKLASVVQRSVLTASTVALMVGPLAAAGAAQTLTDGIETLKLTCEEALKTEDAAVIEEFCTAEELEALGSPLLKSVDEVTKTVDGTAKEAGETVAPKQEEEGETGGQTDPGEVLAGGKDRPKGETEVENTGGNFSAVDEGGGASATTNERSTRGTKVEAKGYGFNGDGPFRPGMQSNSSLTLQPFAAPLVSVPPVYELPQVAQQLFGTTADATAADPQVAGANSTATSASPYSPTGYSATTADPTGWLAATATGLIMLVGAGHALNGGRKPSRSKA